MAYKAVITKLTNVRKHPGADRLNLANVLGNQIVVGLDNVEGQMGIFFPTDGRLSVEYAKANDLIRRTLEDGTKAGGMFDENRKVRAQKLRGEKSDGYWAPIESLAFTGYNLSKLSVGDEIDSLNNVEICRKFITEATLRAQSRQNARVQRSEIKMMKRHFETDQFRNVAEKIPAGSLIIITLKQHGTSHRVAHVLDEVKPKTFWQKFLARFGLFGRPNWKYLHGSRNIILEDLNDPYYSSNFRKQSVERFEGSLHKGEAVYLEIVGWVGESTPIMAVHDVKKVKDKTLLKQYGDKMTYKYGCIPGTNKPYVYRIVMSNEDGRAVELSWFDVKRRCRELGVEHVPEMVQPFIYDGDSANLRKLCEGLSEGPDPIDASHIREGICIRYEHPDAFGIAKLKSFVFNEMESNSKDVAEVADLEESA